MTIEVNVAPLQMRGRQQVHCTVRHIVDIRCFKVKCKSLTMTVYIRSQLKRMTPIACIDSGVLPTGVHCFSLQGFIHVNIS